MTYVETAARQVCMNEPSYDELGSGTLVRDGARAHHPVMLRAMLT